MEPVEGLVRRAQAGDAGVVERQEAFGALVLRFQALVCGYAYALLGDAHLAEDAAQEAFLVAHRQLCQLREPAAFSGWLRRIVQTQCRRMTRHGQGRALATEEGLEGAAAHLAALDADPALITERRADQDAIAIAIAALPERERTVTVLFYLGGYGQQDIATFLGVPVTTVKKRLQIARQQLHERMLAMVRDSLQQQGPSADGRFVEVIQFFAAFEEAALSGEQAVIELLLLDGLDVNVRDRAGRTLLGVAAQRGRLDAVAFLLQRGADVNARDGEGKTALQRAVSGGHRKVAELLRHSGASA
jgi:RNA polymerase sigma factor (sigma-70 family)